MNDPSYRLEVLESVSALSPAAFEKLQGPARYPFLNFGFFRALEQSGVVGHGSGWIPRHLALFRAEELLAFVPGYIKLHSYGEFVFDQGWAQCSEIQLGRPYYPKYVVGVPFTPATGPRFLIHASLNDEERSALLLVLGNAIIELCDELQLSSAHILFCDEETCSVLSEAGFVERRGIQYQFHNPGLANFDAFLGGFRAKKRANIRRERRTVQDRGWRIEIRSGAELGPDDARLAYELYLSTVDKYVWGRRYLNLEFFKILIAEHPDLVHFVTAIDQTGRVGAGAFNLLGQDAIFGRYWGSFVQEPFLHFEVCLYTGIEDTIERGLRRFEAGAGGEHKHGRGLVPTRTRSLHHIAHPTLARLVEDFCHRERQQLEATLASHDEGSGETGVE